MKSERAPGTKKRKRGWNTSGVTTQIRVAVTDWFGKDSHEVTLLEINDMMHCLLYKKKKIRPELPKGMTQIEAHKLMKTFHRLKTNLISSRKSRNYKKKRMKLLETKARKYDYLVQRVNGLETEVGVWKKEIQKLRLQYLVVSDWVGVPVKDMIIFTEQELWFSSMILL